MKAKMNLFPSNHLLESVFNRSISDLMGTDFVSTHPPVNIIEKENGYKIEIAAPGLSKSDFEISIEKDQLVVSGLGKMYSQKGTGTVKRKEFDFTSFKRSFSIDNSIERNDIKASYKSGILSISLSKKEEAINGGPIHIDIK